MKLRNVFVLGFCLQMATANATQWHEPFHSEVVRHATAFARVTVLDANDAQPAESADAQDSLNEPHDEEDGALRIQVLELFAGTAPEHLTLEVYTQAAIFDEAPWLDPGHEYLIFLEHTADGWGIASPAAAHASVADGLVLGHYRNSCTGAIYPPDWYIKTQSLLFESMRGSSAASIELAALIREQLRRPAEAFGGEGDPRNALTFFEQHAANEMLAMLPELAPEVDLEPFLKLTDFHGQISAVRALSARRTSDSSERLLRFLTDTTSEYRAKIVAVRELRSHALSKRQRATLQRSARRADDQPFDLCSGSVMDPRLVEGYTSVSLKQALNELLQRSEPEL